MHAIAESSQQFPKLPWFTSPGSAPPWKSTQWALSGWTSGRSRPRFHSDATTLPVSSPRTLR